MLAMEWSDINDPNGEYEFVGAWNSISTDGLYSPDLIQAMINDNGVPAMVNTVNEHYSMRKQSGPVLQIVKQDGKKLVLQA